MVKCKIDGHIWDATANNLLRGYGCPVCGKTQIKVLYDQDVDGKKVKVCKVCKAALKNKAQKEARLAKKAAAAEAPAPAAEAPAEA